MIDPHVHLRDWDESSKETVKHGISVAYRAGLDGAFEMPNTTPLIISKDAVKDRIKLGDKALKELGIKFFHGIYGGVIADAAQLKEIVSAYKEFFPRMVGLKLYAGHSTGNVGQIEEQQQRLVYATLAKLKFKGVLAVHIEKDSLLKQNLFDPKKPFTHTLARPPIAEVESVDDQIAFAKEEGFKGTMHICHISLPESLDLIESARNEIDFKITCGITPHHATLNDEMMNGSNGLLFKVNPPLRNKLFQQQMLDALMKNRITWIETDHAPHTFKDKTEKFCSGIIGLPYYPHFIKLLREKGMSQEQIDNLTHNNIVETFGIKIKNTKRDPDYNLAKEYPFDVYNISN